MIGRCISTWVGFKYSSGQRRFDVSRDFAVLDLGSNSFHLLVTRLEETGHLLIIDRLKARVRLAAGLDERNI